MSSQESGRESLPEIAKIGQEFDEDACDFCDHYQKRGLSRSSKLLMSFILEQGARESSVVDLGCGAGGFSIELLKQGAGSAIGFDLSPRMIEFANRLAKTHGFDSQARFQRGNAASVELPVSDIVIMDKVLCCYSEWQPLLRNAITGSRAMIGFIVPRDEGIGKWAFRLGVRLMNFFQKRRKRILFYLHPLDRVDKTLRESGFTRVRKKGSQFWLIFLYAKS